MQTDLQHLWPECKHPGCHEQVYFMIDTSKPSRKFLEPSKVYVEPTGERVMGGDLTATMAFPSYPHPSGLCYYHLKKHENLFHAHYPLPKQLKARPMGMGGLARFPTSVSGYKLREVTV